MNNLETEYKVNEQGMIVEEIERPEAKALNSEAATKYRSEPLIFQRDTPSVALLTYPNRISALS